MAMEPAWNTEVGGKKEREQRMVSRERLRSTEMISIIEIASSENTMMQKNRQEHK